jgi:twitching motility two-component system response regulator PilH
LARKILLADDSVTAQNMGRRILVDAGYEVVTVNNGSAALKKIAEQSPDLVVLDVYMPGYSGLEVCQRIKAAAETAAIPVLLTVGKLEPFKAEEARKVFADAFIIKPFEATELLTALTKLEDKIVPQPAAKTAPAKSAPAPAKEAAKREKPQEDQEWKDRLRIQATPVRVEEPEVSAPSATQFHDIRQHIAAAETDEAIAGNLPETATSEERAAITAAVSAFADQQDEVAEESVEVGGEAQREETGLEEVQAGAPIPPVEVEPEAAAAEEQEAVEEFEPTELGAYAEEAESLASISPWANPQLLEEVAAALEQPHAELSPEPEVAAFATAPPAEGFTDSEVDAALASLGADDIMSRLHAEEQAHVRSLDYVDSQAAAAWAEEPTTIGSTKWIAQEMRLEENEASLVLEEEMQKAYAALQAEEEAKASAAQVQSWEESAASAAPLAAETVHDAAPVDVIGSIEVHASQPVEEVAGVAVEEETNAYAAAAAGSSVFPVYADSPVSRSAEAPDQPRTKQEDPELTEAWARWRQIRESVADPQFVSQVADIATAELQNVQQQEPTSNSKPAAIPDANAIASIVDSVLAQLKPKLVEEIARQLSEKK